MFARLVAELWSKFPVICAFPPGIAPWLIAGAEITLPSSTTARRSSGDWVLPYWVYILAVRSPNALVPAPLKLRFTCQNVVPCCVVALALWIMLPSTRDLSSAYFTRCPLIVPQETICRFGSFHVCGVYPISCCHFGLSQLSFLNSAFTWGLTSAAFPPVAVEFQGVVPFASVGTGDAEGVAAAAGLPVADGAGDAAELADGVGLGLVAAVSAAAPPPRPRALRAISATPLCAPPRTKAFVDGLGDAGAKDFFALCVALADGLGEPVGVELGVAVGVGTGVVLFGASSSTWRNSSSAVCSTSFTTACEFWPGTETLMMLAPCCTTDASVKPPAFTRLSMMFTAVFMFSGDGALPCGASACSATVVPLVRSRPSRTWKSRDHLPGLAMLLPTMTRSNRTMTAASTASIRPGLEALLLGGATSSLSFAQLVATAAVDFDAATVSRSQRRPQPRCASWVRPPAHARRSPAARRRPHPPALRSTPSRCRRAPRP